jgi:S1-C subfamily serine protease
MRDRYPPSYPATSYLWPLLLLIVLGGLLLWRFGPSVPLWWGTSSGPPAEPRAVTARGDLGEDEQATIKLYETAAPSVVHITAIAYQRNSLNLRVQEMPRGTGSGFVWDDRGHVVTNYHVIEGAGAAQVTLGDQSTYRATLVGAYPDKDLAVLKVDAPASRLHPIMVGSSGDLKVGQKAFAIGNPFGLDQTLTTGVVSAVNREIESVTRRPIRGVIQTDAAINPGNSGGPLLDSAARLIGVNTAIYSPSGASAGIGFAIPVDEVNRVVPQIINHGKVVRPVLGVQVATDRQAAQLGVKGALVLVVLPDSPAARAADPIRPTTRDPDTGRIILGDIIQAIDGKDINAVKDLTLTLEQYKVGDVVKVRVLRDGETTELTVTLDAAN